MSLRNKLRAMRITQKPQLTPRGLAALINPVLRGWLGYFQQYGRSTLNPLLFDIERKIPRWMMKKHRIGVNRAVIWLKRWRSENPKLFAHWTFNAVG